MMTAEELAAAFGDGEVAVYNDDAEVAETEAVQQ